MSYQNFKRNAICTWRLPYPPRVPEMIPKVAEVTLPLGIEKCGVLERL